MPKLLKLLALDEELAPFRTDKIKNCFHPGSGWCATASSDVGWVEMYCPHHLSVRAMKAIVYLQEGRRLGVEATNKGAERALRP